MTVQSGLYAASCLIYFMLKGHLLNCQICCSIFFFCLSFPSFPVHTFVGTHSYHHPNPHGHPPLTPAPYDSQPHNFLSDYDNLSLDYLLLYFLQFILFIHFKYCLKFFFHYCIYCD